MASTALVVPSVVLAQQDDSGGLTEVIVTAQKRAEDLQRVPISLQVLGTETLEELQIRGFDDYARFLSSVSYQSAGPGLSQLYFRGIASGGDGLHAGSQPATGMYIDETPITTIGGQPDVYIYDMARIEALAGPQGTLFGASSLSGTLRLITNAPDPSAFSAAYDVNVSQFGDGDTGYGFQGFVNAPMGEKAAIRLVGYYNKEGGYIDNIPQTRTYPYPGLVPDEITIDNDQYVKSDFNDVETYGGRLAIAIDINDRWTLTPGVIYQNQEAGGTFAYDPTKGDYKVTDFRPDSFNDEWYQAYLTVEGKISNFDLVYNFGYFGRDVENFADYSYYSVSYVAYGYFPFYNAGGELIDPTQYTRFYDEYTKLTNEVRLLSPQGEKLNYVVGLFWQTQTDDIRHEFRIDDLVSAYVPYQDPVGVYDARVTGQQDIIYMSDQKREDKDFAAFGQFTYEFTDKWAFTGGARYFEVDNSLYGFFGYNSNLSANGEALCFEPAPVGSGRPCINTDKVVKEDGWTWKASLAYQATESDMYYATISTGFRPGGVNRRVNIIPYDSDTLTNYELGWKTEWKDNTLRFNGAVFFEQWDDMQYGLAGLQGITDIFNAGDAESYGVEIEFSWAVSDAFLLSAGGTWVDAELTTNFCPAPDGVVVSDCPDPLAPEGTALPVTPSFKANATGRYSFATGGLESFVQGSLVYVDGVTATLDLENAVALGDTDPFTTFDLSVGTGRDSWWAELFVQNLFDERGEITRFGQCAIGLCLSQPRVYTTTPQLFGLRFGQRF
jgi:outer membrane receptor protein involved in Fe transport